MRNLLLSAAFTLVGSLLLSPTQGQAQSNYPNKQVSIILGYPPGGQSDVLIRALAPRLAAEWKQPVVVENRPGANEVIAAQLASRAPADGYTLFMCTETALTQNPFLFRSLPYNPEKDFAPVTQMVKVIMGLAVNAKVPVNTLSEYIALVKGRSAGNPISYGSVGTGGVMHLPMAMLAKQNGLNMLHVPYKGGGPATTDLLSGQIDSIWLPVSGLVPFMRDGRLKVLVVDAPARVKSMPDVPTFSETGVAPVQAAFMLAMMAPAGTPKEITEKVSSTINKIMSDPKFRETQLDPFGLVLVGSTPSELATYLTMDRPRQAERIKISGAELN
jgi:tripartite-type tricarboxylate transporter receptor subunit TctC